MTFADFRDDPEENRKLQEEFKNNNADRVKSNERPETVETKPKKPKRQTKSYLREVYEYAKNQAKWKAAKEFCEDRLWEFKVMTENELGIK